MAVPSPRALEGRLLRKSRTDLDLAEKGLTLVLTSVMKRVIILFELDGHSTGARSRARLGGRGRDVVVGVGELERGSNRGVCKSWWLSKRFAFVWLSVVVQHCRKDHPSFYDSLSRKKSRPGGGAPEVAKACPGPPPMIYLLRSLLSGAPPMCLQKVTSNLIQSCQLTSLRTIVYIGYFACRAIQRSFSSLHTVKKSYTSLVQSPQIQSYQK